jgi:parvulin-like peptidyl-prolyl isomerase
MDRSVRLLMSRPARLLAPLALLALVLAACGPGGDPSVAATVNGEDVPIAQVEERYDAISANPQFAQQLEADEDGTLREQVQARILSDLIETRIVAQGASELGVEVTDADVAERREELVEEVGGQEQFDTLVSESGLTEAQIDEQIRELALREQVQEELTADVEVTDEEIESFFEANREQRFERAEARHILVETEEEAEDVLTRLEDGEDFAEIAEEESIDTGSGAQGGDLGEFGRGQMVPEFEEAVFTAEPGELVGPIETQFGFHVIEVIERQEPDLDEVSDEIRAELAQAREGEAVQTWLTEQRQAAEVTVNPRFGEWDAERGEVVSAAGPLGGPDAGVGAPAPDAPPAPPPGDVQPVEPDAAEPQDDLGDDADQ